MLHVHAVTTRWDCCDIFSLSSIRICAYLDNGWSKAKPKRWIIGCFTLNIYHLHFNINFVESLTSDEICYENEFISERHLSPYKAGFVGLN